MSTAADALRRLAVEHSEALLQLATLLDAPPPPPAPSPLSVTGIHPRVLAAAVDAFADVEGFEPDHPCALLGHVIDAALAQGFPVVGYPPPEQLQNRPPSEPELRAGLEAALEAYTGGTIPAYTEEQAAAFVGAIYAAFAPQGG